MNQDRVIREPSTRQAQRSRRREMILAIATDSFLANGYAGTAMSAIAAALGGSKSTLWSHFPSKAELFEAALDQAIANHHARLSQHLDPGEDLASTLNRFGTDFVEILTSRWAIALHRLVIGRRDAFPRWETFSIGVC